jgi:hypothetical protein
MTAQGTRESDYEGPVIRLEKNAATAVDDGRLIFVAPFHPNDNPE